MADEKISALTSAGALAGTEPLPIVQGGVTVKTTVQDIADLATPNLQQVLAVGNTSGANDIQFDATQGLLFDNASRLREGTIDAGLGGLKGIAQICGAGYELKWENGRLYVMGSSGNTIRQSLYNFNYTPSTSDDVTLGYQVGSLWTLDDGTVYECTDASTGAAVWVLSGNNLQSVTDNGATTTNPISVNASVGPVKTVVNVGSIELTSPANQTVSISGLSVAAAYTAHMPNKSGIETFAMLSDIPSGGVASVSSGTNISVTGTSTNPIINSLSDRYKTSSVTSNTIGNGSKIFTVDANLAYIPLQEVLIVYDPSNHMHGTVTSYSGTTLIVDVNHHTGGGTFASWVINLDGIPIDAITGAGTSNQISYFTSGQVIASLDTATYPSLTELSYVKGATSAIQTQINGKMTNPMTTGGDIIYGGSSGAPTRLANGTAGQILQSNGTTLAPSWVAAPSGTNTYAFNVQSYTLAAPLDATSYHFGIIGDIMGPTTLRREFKFTQAGTMTAFSFNLLQATNGSNETCTLYLRNTTTSTDYTIGTFTSDFNLNGALKTLYSGLSIAVNTTDNWVIKILTPTWTINPTTWQAAGIISITT